MLRAASIALAVLAVAAVAAADNVVVLTSSNFDEVRQEDAEGGEAGEGCCQNK